MIKCFKQGMTMVGILDDFISFTFSRSYSGLGTWDLEVDGNSLNAQRITGMDFISVSDGVAGLVTRESRDGDILSFHGVELKGLAYTRIIVPVTGDAYLNYNNKTPEYIIHSLINSQIVNPENADRKILDTAVNVPSVLSTGITKQYRFKNLGESIEELALAYNLGWYADIQDGVITFSIYAGKDRTAAQAVNDRLILSRDRDTIVNAEHIVNKNIPKTALVAGQGEGTGRAIVMIGDDLADLQRNEVYIDARDIEDAANLPSRGIERLADYSTEDVYNVSLGRILVDQYRVNYDLGDIGTLSEINTDARLTEITEVYEDNVLELKSVFGRDAVRLKNVINKIYSETESIVNKEGVTTSDITDFPSTMPPSEHNHDAAYAAASHPHGNITSDGKVGTTADLTLMTGTGGLVVARTMAEAIAIWGLKKDNLLHNWDFRNPVNQRGVSGAISTGAEFYDRWIRNSGTVTTNAAYLTIGAGAVIEQRIEGKLLAGKTVTVSVMAGGTVYSGTGTMPTSAGTASVTLTGWGTATLGYAAGYMYVRLSPIAASNIQAVKLELGTVSTLAYDPPMDYGSELAKCRRYCYVIREATEGADLLHGVSQGANTGRFKVDFPVPMRIAPTFSASGSYMMGYQSGTGYTSVVYSVTQALSRFNFSIVNAQIDTSILSDWRYTAVLFVYNSPCAITFSADL